MPYKRIGKSIYHYKDGQWEVKQRCKSVENAKAAFRLLEGIEHKTLVPRKRKK